MSLRLFAALSVPEEVRDRLTPLQKGVGGAKWRPRENFHITLCFFGELTHADAQELDANLAQISARPFEVTIAGAGAFGARDPHTLWLGGEENEPLKQLASACRKAARQSGLEVESRPYVPHVTMAYLNGADTGRVAAFIQRWSSWRMPPFTARSFQLYSSRPAKYGANHYVEEAVYPFLG